MPAALLLGVVVADGGAVLHPPEPVDRAGAVEQRLGQRRLAGAAVAHQGHVADLVGREALHSDPPRWSTLRVKGQGSHGPLRCARGRRARCACPTAAPSPTTTSGDPDRRAGRLPPRHARLPARPARRRRRPRRPGCGCSPSTGPGFGDSDLDPGADPRLARRRPGAPARRTSGVERAVLLGWSGGGLAALGAAATGRSAPRLAALGLDRHAAAGRGLRRPRRARARSATAAAPSPRSPREVPAAELAAEVAPYLVPDPLDADDRPRPRPRAGRRGRPGRAGPRARRRRRAGRRAAGERAAAARTGLAGDIERQLERGPRPRRRSPARCAPSTARSTRSRRPRWAPGSSPACPNAVLDLTPDAGHHLLFPRWRGILRALRRDAGI